MAQIYFCIIILILCSQLHIYPNIKIALCLKLISVGCRGIWRGCRTLWQNVTMGQGVNFSLKSRDIIDDPIQDVTFDIFPFSFSRLDSGRQVTSVQICFHSGAFIQYTNTTAVVVTDTSVKLPATAKSSSILWTRFVLLSLWLQWWAVSVSLSAQFAERWRRCLEGRTGDRSAHEPQRHCCLLGQRPSRPVTMSRWHGLRWWADCRDGDEASICEPLSTNTLLSQQTSHPFTIFNSIVIVNSQYHYQMFKVGWLLQLLAP